MEQEIKEVTEVTEVTGVTRKRKWPTKHLPEGVTEAQKVFAINYAETLDAKKSAKIAYPNTKHPAEMGYQLKQKSWVKDYIASTMMECAQIQMNIITNEKAPFAVRMDGIKDRLNRGGVVWEEEQDASVSIGDIIINVAK